MLNEEFVKELYALCVKHKTNITATIDSTELNIDHYEVDITGAWSISKDHTAVEVHSISYDNLVYTINGEK